MDLDILRVASVTVEGKDPIFATSVVWLLGNGYILELVVQLVANPSSSTSSARGAPLRLVRRSLF